MDKELQLPVKILVIDELHCSHNCFKHHEGSCVAVSVTGELLMLDVQSGETYRTDYCIANAKG
jgi:hypothetical protein